MEERRVAVVGGGLAGLAAGYTLQRAGVDVTLFEAGERLGGRACTEELDGVRIDPGAQLFGSMYTRFLRLVREAGLSDRLARSPGRDALWRDGRTHEVVYGSVTSMATSGGLPFRTKLKLGTTYVPFLARHARDLDLHAPDRAAIAGLDEESIEAWGEREIDSTFVRALVYPQLGAYYGGLPEETSAGFYHILAHYGMDVSLFAVAGGVGQVAERVGALIGEFGGSVRTGTAVTSLDVAGTEVRVASAAGEERFDGVITATPAPATTRLLGDASPTLVDALGTARYRPTLSLALLLDRKLGVPFFGLSFPRGESRYLAALAVQENKGVPLSKTGGALIAFPTPESAPELIGLDSRVIFEMMLPEIARAFPGIESRVTRARVYRWRVGTPVIYPGYLRRLGDLRRGRPERDGRLALAGDYLYGPSVEGAVVSGIEAANRLLLRIR